MNATTCSTNADCPGATFCDEVNLTCACKIRLATSGAPACSTPSAWIGLKLINLVLFVIGLAFASFCVWRMNSKSGAQSWRRHWLTVSFAFATLLFSILNYVFELLFSPGGSLSRAGYQAASSVLFPLSTCTAYMTMLLTAADWPATAKATQQLLPVQPQMNCAYLLVLVMGLVFAFVTIINIAVTLWQENLPPAERFISLSNLFIALNAFAFLMAIITVIAFQCAPRMLRSLYESSNLDNGVTLSISGRRVRLIVRTAHRLSALGVVSHVGGLMSRVA